jgi:DNA-directed RNA polymerase subunit F
LASDEESSVTIGELLQPIPGYKLHHVPRPGSSYGGVGLIYKDNLNVTFQTQTTAFSSFEHLEVLITAASKTVRLIVLYRAPPSQKNRQNSGIFFEEFSEMMDSNIFQSGNLLITGDFNFHPNDEHHPDTTRLASILSSYNLKQHINVPTHKLGNTLDLVITRLDESTVDNINVTNPDISDHFMIQMELLMTKPLPASKVLSYRKMKAINICEFKNDIQNSEMYSAPAIAVSALVDQYNSVLTELLDKHAPIKTKTVTSRPTCPWYNAEIAEAKRTRKKAERRWKRTKLVVHQDMYKSLKHGVNSLIEKSKREYYQGLVNDNSNNSKKLYKVVNTLLNKTNEQHLPSHDSAKEVANRFGNYFHDKIVKIREDLSTLRESVTHEEPPTEPVQCRLTEFEPASEKEVKKIIMDTASKSCMLDPMPTSLLKDCLDALLPFITKIVNISLSTNIMPVNLKEAIITPLLKKLKLDPELLKFFQPISNLTYISKLIERVVAARFNTHMKENNLHEIMQSAYRSGHSTETALLKVKDDILQAIDNHQCVLLILLDLSAAFDTVDHEVLLTRL